jgi:hypothetical protein
MNASKIDLKQSHGGDEMRDVVVVEVDRRCFRFKEFSEKFAF